MTTLENADVGLFVRDHTIARPGVATAVGRLRAAYQEHRGPIGKNVFLAELGRAGCTLIEHDGVTLIAGRYLPEEPATCV
jgi:hypothetical protein